MRALPALLLVAALLASAHAAMPVRADDDGEEGRGHAREGGDRPSSADRLAEARAEGREAFEDEVEEAEEACERLRGRNRTACLAEVAAARAAFEAEQRQAHAAAQAALRGRQPWERLGGFDAADHRFQGRFVAFRWDPANLSLLDYTVGGVLVFERVHLAGATSGAKVELEPAGKSLRVEAGRGRLVVSDTPGGAIAARAPRGGELRFEVNPALAAQAPGDQLRLEGPGGFRAVLRAEDLAFAEGLARAPDKATFLAHEANVVVPAAANAHRGAIQAAKEQRQVGAEVTVAATAAGAAEAEVLDAPLQVATEASEGRVRVVLNGTDLGPRTLVVNVAGGVLAGDRLAVAYYDEIQGRLVQVPIVEAQGGLADVLDPADDSTPEYWIVKDADGVQVLVSVPRFSLHVVEVMGVLEEVPPSVLAGSLGAVLFVGLAAAGLFRRRPPPPG